MTPPNTGGLDVLVSLNEEGETPDSVWTPVPSPANQAGNAPHDYFLTTPPHVPPLPHLPRHKRAHSCSTVDDHTSVRDPEVGVFKVVIERPATGTKMEEPFVGIPTLEVPIPSYKLGTPRFSARGTPFFRSSSYSSAADEGRSSVLSLRDASHRGTSTHLHSRIHSRRHSDASAQPHHSVMGPSASYSSSPLPPPGIVRHSTAITPEIFDGLTFKPACDHPSVVRYNPNGGIKAATPLRLVAEITSPTFVDYHLLSDFFLTFRSYLLAVDLLYMLIARLRWAFLRDDGPGMVVRVRTFVAIRHWILNYFPDDYVIDYSLRKTFCELLNSLVSELSHDPKRSKVSLKILGELKKCWRRVCALYWDGAEFDPELDPDVPIHPGGVSGSRNPKLDSDFDHAQPDGPSRLEGIIEPDLAKPKTPPLQARIAVSEVPRARNVNSVAGQEVPPIQTDRADTRPWSPTSVASEDFISCSLPSRARVVGSPYPPVVHPVPAGAILEAVQPVAITPKALTGKRVRPANTHKRSGSFSDSCRDHPAQHQAQKDMHITTEPPPNFPYAGSLVRGNVFPPAEPVVDVVAPGTPAHINRAITMFPDGVANQRGPSAMSGPGMKKLLGSVRRALSTKAGSGPNSSPTQGSFPHIPPLGVRGATVNRLPGTAVVPQARPRHVVARAPMRIDLLGAEVAEDFKRAVQEDAEAERREENDRNSTHIERDPTLQYPTLRPDPQKFLKPRAPLSALTDGSKSIVIVDDTMELNLPTSTGALSANMSVDAFTDPFLQPSGGPTPPSTPPEVPVGTPRRSSHLLGEHTRNPSASLEVAPPLPLKVNSHPIEDELSRSTRPPVRRSLRSHMLSASQNSVSLRRYASYQSGITRHGSELSFDATTMSESEDPERLSHKPSVIPPRRVLRRRPGGDLRAVTNVGDLHIRVLRRPMSTGSLATYSDSARSSYLQDVDAGGYVNVVSTDFNRANANAQTFSLGALAEAVTEKRGSLFSTHSSQPRMRPSFEKEAQMLAQIPDDADDDGGVESALLKLEGKYERRSGVSGKSVSLDPVGSHNSFGAAQVDDSAVHNDEEEKRKHRQGNILKANLSLPIQTNQPAYTESGEELQPSVYQLEEPPRSPRLVESYNSIPLLDRDISDDMERRRTRDWSEHSILRGPSQDRQHDQPTPASSHPSSFNFIYETESMKGIRSEQMKPSNEGREDSFLESDSDDRSDLSSELSLEVISRTEYTEHNSTSASTFPLVRPGTVMKEIALPSHPLRHPPSPPITLRQALRLSPENANMPQIREELLRQEEAQYPPPPDAIQKGLVIEFNTDRIASPSMDPLRSHLLPEASRKTSVHLPFTLAFDSQVLAQQFTLIEKDALNEIDWKDLIEMRWKNATADPRSWVDFLRTSEPRGVEVVIARFNLMVKWAISECLLTEDLGERVQCITKYIHIAAHCRKYRNFTTMTQLTIALTSKDIQRLTRTWLHVPAADMKTLRELEILITPENNFHRLRAEMEGCNTDQGCIPFLGIYTHDLLVNLERPSEIASTPITEPLVNFERCRADATIIKNLLRLLEASQLYKFLPIEGITERCLWMAALSDEEIFRYGRNIQA
jgi:hypothetical protein